MARVVAHDIPDGSYVNLEIGQPTTVADYLSPSSGVVLHTEKRDARNGAGCSR